MLYGCDVTIYVIMHSFRLRYVALGLFIYVQMITICETFKASSYDELPSQTVLASTVVDVTASRKIRPPSSAREGYFLVQFKVSEVFKGRIPEDARGRYRTLTVNICSHRESMTCLKDSPSFSRGSRYILFLGDVTSQSTNDISSYTLSAVLVYQINGYTDQTTSDVIQQIKDHACDGCAKAPRIVKVSKKKIEKRGKKLRLHCRSSGKPEPQIVWYKDGVPLKQDKRTSTFKSGRNSLLVIRRSTVEDSGRYQCQARSVLGVSAIDSTEIIVTDGHQKPFSKPCTGRNKLKCFNGGECYTLIPFNKDYCQCAENYVGDRCDEKLAGVIAKARLKKRSSCLLDKLTTSDFI